MNDKLDSTCISEFQVVRSMEIRKFFETGGMVPEENPWENFPN